MLAQHLFGIQATDPRWGDLRNNLASTSKAYDMRRFKFPGTRTA